MTKIESYKDLIAYQKAYEVCLRVYEATRTFPRQETYGLTAQLRRCAVSISSNIAEGYRRKNRREYLQFLHIASGSCAELETQIHLAKDLRYLEPELAKRLYESQEEVSRLLRGLIRSLEYARAAS
jgi:four helix bundle protein